MVRRLVVEVDPGAVDDRVGEGDGGRQDRHDEGAAGDLDVPQPGPGVRDLYETMWWKIRRSRFE